MIGHGARLRENDHLPLASIATKKPPFFNVREIMRRKDAQCNTKESP